MDQPKLRAGQKKPAEIKIFVGTSTSGPPNTTAVAAVDVGLRPDNFRTAIVIPESKEPYPTIDLQFETTDNKAKTAQIVMDQFC